LRRTTLAIKQTRIRDYRYFCVTCPKPGGGRTRRFFRDRRLAQTFFEQCRIQQQNFGTAAFSISDSLRIEAAECAGKLSAVGHTLTDATKFFLARLRTTSKSRKVAEVITELLAARTGDQCSRRYIGDLRARLARFAASFGEQIIAEISAREIDDWLRTLGVGAVTRNTFRRRVAVLFSFAKKRGYIEENPIVSVERAKDQPGEIEILTVADTARLLSCAAKDMIPFWSIGAFAGLRRAEIERLVWEEVDFEAGLIEVTARKSKTSSRRLVRMEANLREWLAPYHARVGRLCPKNLQRRINDDRDRAQLREN
jgi:integrase